MLKYICLLKMSIAVDKLQIIKIEKQPHLRGTDLHIGIM
jgi:hypothetical protein